MYLISFAYNVSKLRYRLLTLNIDLLFGMLKKNIIENMCFLFPPILIFILIMDRNIKNNKNSARIPQYTHKFL